MVKLRPAWANSAAVSCMYCMVLWSTSLALEKSISNLDAQVTSTGDSLLYAWQVFDTLYGFDAVGNLVPRMASAGLLTEDAATNSVFQVSRRHGCDPPQALSLIHI